MTEFAPLMHIPKFNSDGHKYDTEYIILYINIKDRKEYIRIYIFYWYVYIA